MLGAGAYGEGLDASRLFPEGKGCGLLRGVEAGIEGGRTVRTYFADGRDAEAICVRARALRMAAGTLSGAALGLMPTAAPPTHSVSADVVQVMGMEEKAHSDVLCSRLADTWPERYAEWTPTQLGAALKPFGIRTRQVWAEGIEGQRANRYGVVRAELLAVLDKPADP